MSPSVAHCPAPQADETLSSMILRMARRHSATAHEFCNLVWPEIEFWTRDIDRTITDESIEILCRATSVPVQSFQDATLRGLAKFFADEISPIGCQPGILPIGVFHRVRRSYGQQYCATCLDQIPAYLRRHWRLELVVACPIHHEMLKDCCRNCGAPFIPHRDHALMYRRCHQCGSSLCGGGSEAVSGSVIGLQQLVLERLGVPIASSPQSPSPPPSGNLWKGLVELETEELVVGIRRLCQAAASYLEASETGGRKRATAWYLRRTSDRARAVDVVAGWLDAWPDAWIDWADAAGFSKRSLQQRHGEFPGWIAVEMDRFACCGIPIHHRKRRITRLQQLRQQSPSVASYRDERAAMLLRRAYARIDR